GRTFALSARGTVLRRPCRRARVLTKTGAAQRCQPARHQFLSLGEARLEDCRAAMEYEPSVLRVSHSVQRATRGWPRRHGGGGCALLLLEPYRLQRAVPLQPRRRVQRALRTLRQDQLLP